MKKQILFNELMIHAQKEAAPKVDVADSVLGTLAMGSHVQLVSYKPLVWIAAFSSAAAAGVVLFMHLSSNVSSASTMSEFYQAISWVVQ